MTQPQQFPLIAIGSGDTSGNKALVDGTGALKVTGTVTETNASIGLTGATAPTSATEIGIVDGSGNLQNVSATNPLPSKGASEGATGSTAPTSATELGFVSGGNLVPVSMANPLPVTSVNVVTVGPSVDIQSGVITHTSKNSPANLISAFCQNTSAGTAYLQFWNGATAGTGTLKDVVLVPAGTSTVPGLISLGTNDWSTEGLPCTTALTWGLSSTTTTYTAIGSATGFLVSVKYI